MRACNLGRRRRRLAHIPFANTRAVTALKNVEMDVAIVITVGARPQHRGETMAGGLLQLLTQRLSDSRVSEFYAPAIGKHEGAHVDGIALSVLAQFGTQHTVAATAFVGIIGLDAAQRSAEHRDVA